MMGLTPRQVFRLAKQYRTNGPAALASKRRGKPSNRSHPAIVRTEVLALIKAQYADFGPTLAAEKLAERHGLRIGVETLRQWMLVEGIWQSRKQRLARVYQPRHRRDCLGELVQIDGSEHWWFEGGDRNAPSSPSSTTPPARSCMQASWRQNRPSTISGGSRLPGTPWQAGRVLFRQACDLPVNSKEAKNGDGMTQFGRALDELNIDIICASAPQSKGRIERCFGTLQDRLVKEMRLEGIDTPATGNLFLTGFLARHNARFAKAPFSDRNAHRSLGEATISTRFSPGRKSAPSRKTSRSIRSCDADPRAE